MHDLQSIWSDESGSVISAELVTIGTMLTVGAVVGLQEVSTAINEELRDVTKAIRSLDQSYSYRGFAGCNSMTAGSAFIDTQSRGEPRPQEPVQKPIAPRTSDSTTGVLEPQAGFLIESEVEPLADESPTTPADDKL